MPAGRAAPFVAVKEGMRALLLATLLTVHGWADPLAHKVLQGTSATVDIFLTKVKDAKGSRAWCYKSSGLKPQDLTVTVLIKPGEEDAEYPEEPVKLLQSFALQKAPLEGARVADLQGKSFLNGAMTGLLFVEGEALVNVPHSEDCLAIVGLFQNEMDVADLAGPSRVMGALANQTRFYPCPVWCDRGRTSTFTSANLQQMKEEPTSKVFPYHSDASIMTSKGLMSLRIRPQTGQKVAADLAAHKAVRLGLEIDPRANAFLIWTSQQDHLEAVNPHHSDGSQMSGQHVVFLPGQKQDECRTFGDGYILFLTTQSFQKLVAALKNGSPFSLGLGGEEPKKFALSWVKTDYYNPVEKTTYTNKNGWVEYNSGAKPGSGVVSLKEVVLLTPDQELGRSLTVEALSAYVKQLEAVALVQLKPLHTKKPLEVLLQCDLTGKNRYLVAVKPPPAGIEPLMKNFYAALAKVKVPPSRGPAKFHLIFTVKPH